VFDGLRFQELGGKNVLDCWEMTNTMQVSVEPHPSKHGREKKTWFMGYISSMFLQNEPAIHQCGPIFWFRFESMNHSVSQAHSMDGAP